MKRKFWPGLISLVFIVLFALLVSKLYDLKQAPPSDSWSHHRVLVPQLDDANRKRVDVLQDDATFFVFWIDDYHLSYRSMSLEAELTDVQTVFDIGNDIYKLQMRWVEPGHIAEAIILDEKGVSVKRLDLDTQTIVSSVSLFEGHFGKVRELGSSDHMWGVLYLDELVLYDEANNEVLRQAADYQSKLVMKTLDGYDYVVINGSLEGYVYTFDQTGHLLDQMSLFEPQRTDQLGYLKDFNIEDGVLGLGYANYTYANKNETWYSVVTWDLATKTLLNVHRGRYDFTDELFQVSQMGQRQGALIVSGRTQFGSNLVELSLMGNKTSGVKPLTKTLSAALNPKLYTHEGNSYLFWIELHVDQSEIMVASNAPGWQDFRLDVSVIDMVFNGFICIIGSLLNLVFDAASVIPFGILTMLIMLRLQNRREWPAHTAFTVAALVHVVAKVVYAINYAPLKQVAFIFPELFSSWPAFLGLSLVVSGILYVATLNFKTHVDLDSEHYAYLFFGVLDIFAYLMLIEVYRFAATIITRL